MDRARIIYITICCVAAVVQLAFNLIDCSEFPIDIGEKLCTENATNMQFDIIICGGGSAGSVLAERLSEVGSWNVLILERGGYPPARSSIPLMWASMLNTEFDYQYKSESDAKIFRGLKDGVSSIPRGKLLGGTSGINVAMYFRGTERDFDVWKKLGIDGWSHDQVYPYMLKAENFHDDVRFDKNVHSTKGYLHVSPFEAPDPLIKVFSDALTASGYERLNDLNVQQTNGFGYADSTTHHGLRCSTANGYLTPSKNRPNLFYAGQTIAKRIIIDESVNPMRAKGVEIQTAKGTSCIIEASTEIIISMGAIASPQILMLSGIGPKDHLESFNIPVVKNLPVGIGYQDHACFPGVVMSDRKSRNSKAIQADSDKLIADTYGLIGKGISTMGLTQLVTFFNTNGEKDYWHDIQLMKMRISKGTMFNTVNGLHKMYNMYGFSDESAKLVTDLNQQTDTIFFIVILSEPNSRGYVQLKSTDIMDSPKIVTRLLSDEQDMNSLVRGVKMAVDIAQHEIVRDYGVQLERLDFKYCENFTDIGDQGYWRCAIEQIATGFYHPASTVRMGSPNDESAVLTPNFLVKDFDNLRVIDASAMTKLVARNPNAVVVMMAEKAADLIKLKYQKI